MAAIPGHEEVVHAGQGPACNDVALWLGSKEAHLRTWASASPPASIKQLRPASVGGRTAPPFVGRALPSPAPPPELAPKVKGERRRVTANPLGDPPSL